MLSINYAQAVITPSLEPAPYLAGFGQNRRARSRHDDLYVRALALTDCETRLVLAALDLIGLTRQHCRELEEQLNEQCPEVRLILACTHTHHGPDTIGLWGPDPETSGVDSAYMLHLKETILATCQAALAGGRPAGLRHTGVDVPGVAKNARDPEIRDEELTCLQFVSPEGNVTLATLLVFPCHPEVLWDNNPHLTADYIYALRRIVEARTGAPCLIFVGALGGMMTPDVQDHAFAEAEAMGAILARAAAAALADCGQAKAVTLAHRRTEYDIPFSSPLFELAIQRGLVPDLRNATGGVTTETNLIKLGPAWLVTVPGELFPALGLALKADLRRAGAETATVIGLANDELGYILPEADYLYPQNPLAPGEHYEETMSVGPQAGPRLLAAIQRLL